MRNSSFYRSFSRNSHSVTSLLIPFLIGLIQVGINVQKYEIIQGIFAAEQGADDVANKRPKKAGTEEE